MTDGADSFRALLRVTTVQPLLATLHSPQSLIFGVVPSLFIMNSHGQVDKHSNTQSA